MGLSRRVCTDQIKYLPIRVNQQSILINLYEIRLCVLLRLHLCAAEVALGGGEHLWCGVVII